jgi:predicted amidohydrolase
MARYVTIATLNMGYHVNGDTRGGYTHPSNLPFGETLENNLALFEQKILEAKERFAAEFVCFSEVGLSLGLEGEELKRSIIAIPGPELDRLAAAASRADCYAIVAAYERGEDHNFNTAAVLGPDGSLVGKYRKVHITPGAYISDRCVQHPGDSWPVFETRRGRIGIVICYDYYFPESVRCVALGGAEIVFCPTMEDERGFEQVMALQRARAIDNAVYYVSSTTFCGGRESRSGGRSVIIDPMGVVRADSGLRDGWAAATVDLDDPFPQREAGVVEPQHMRKLLLKCRRPDTYGFIVAPKPEVPWSEVLLDDSPPRYPDV